MHPTGGNRRVFEQFAWLEVVSDKIALPRPAHQRVTPAVGWLRKPEFIERRIYIQNTLTEIP